jgi:hypothetical protein
MLLEHHSPYETVQLLLRSYRLSLYLSSVNPRGELPLGKGETKSTVSVVYFYPNEMNTLIKYCIFYPGYWFGVSGLIIYYKYHYSSQYKNPKLKRTTVNGPT